MRVISLTVSSRFILSIDPGVSTGIALLEYLPDEAPELVTGWQFKGGVGALKEWLPENLGVYGVAGDGEWVWAEEPILVIAEKFTARATKGFSYTTASLEPLRCEGLLIGSDFMPDYSPAEKRWRDPGLQYLVGGKDKADKKKRQHAFLKDSGFYRTGKQLDAADADDFRSACAHGLAYLAREVKHKPTFELISEWSGK